ncbi:TRAM domain-containing protein [Natrononativus amylolyticus]|uniref:TRAM domain-containing protein n=1 Tax=Natrononativus amylolyticus TaxID=2963434 RepID=UPI0031F32FD8
MFSAQITDTGGRHVIEIPPAELTAGDVRPDETYRIALLPTQTDGDKSVTVSATERRSHADPPVREGDTRTVDIESLGDQGDGIARVERGYVVIVPEAEKGERVTIEITSTKENVAFGEVLARQDYYE